MKEFNKIKLAGEMLVEARSVHMRATKGVDYASSLLLSGAANQIIAPLLAEHAIESSQKLMRNSLTKSCHLWTLKMSKKEWCA